MRRAEHRGGRTGDGTRAEAARVRFRARLSAAPVAAVLLLIALLSAGCGGGGGGGLPEVPEGVHVDGEIDTQVRESVEDAAQALLADARDGDWDAIWESTAARVREQTPREQFLGSIRQVGSVVGFPASLETRSLAVVRFGETYPVREKVTHQPEDEDAPLTLIVPDFPLQASLVQISPGGEERFYFSTLWFREEGAWRLAAFFAKPATAYGRTWEAYEEQASDERMIGRARNAALLYNLAIDLVVPAAWIKPAEVVRMERAQRRINVTHLPAGRLMPWPASPDTFQVFQARYNILPSGLGLLFGYESPVPTDDAEGQEEYAQRLHRYIEESFPEYSEVFATVTLQAYDPATHAPFWSRNFPLEKRP